MRWFCAILAAAVLSLFLVPSVDAAKAKKAGKKKAAGVKGTVVKVDKDSIEIQTRVNKKKNPDAKPEKKTFQLTTDAKVQKVTGKKADQKIDDVKVTDITPNSRVVVTLTDGKASLIKFNAAAPKKKAKKQQ